MSETKVITEPLDTAAAGTRIDAYIAGKYPEYTRSFIKKLCDEGRVQVNGKAVKASFKAGEGILTIEVPPVEPIEAQPEDIPLNIVYEDEHLAVINKPRGLVVHPAAGNYTGTLVNALLFAMEDLSGINGELKPGIVHRIDKDTTGLLVVAKNDAAHRSLAEQIKTKQAQRIYLALVQGNVAVDQGTVCAPIGRDPKERKRMAIVPGGRDATTHYKVLERFGDYTLLECRLETGRTHQIRVHMKSLGHPLVGDEVYGYKKQRFNVEGQLLHAACLMLKHPVTGELMTFNAPIPEDFSKVLDTLRRKIQ